jgi:dipeptidyl aminopeptidase/acylaminoacyl peptidase
MVGGLEMRALLLVALAAPAQVWSPEVAMRVKTVGSVVPSPDGRRVVYTVTSALLGTEKSEQLTHVFLDGRPLTRGEKSCTAPQWSPDARWVLFLSKRGEAQNVWRIPVDGGEAEPVTESKSDVAAFALAPGGKQVAYVAPDPPSAEKEKAKKEKRDFRVVDQDPENHRLWLVEWEKREPRQLAAGDFHVRGITWSPDSARLAYERQPTPIADDWTRLDIWEVTVADGTARPLAATPASESSPYYSPDGTLLAYARSSHPVRWAREERIVFRTAAGEREAPPTPDEQPRLLGWSGDSRRVYFSEGHGTKALVYAMPLDGPPARVAEPREGIFSAFELNLRGTHLGLVGQAPNRPQEAYVLETRDGATPSRVSNANAGLPAFPAIETKLIQWKSPDGLDIEGLLTYPAGYQAGRRVPLILNVHGGPAGVFTETFLGGPGVYPLATLAERGFAILRANIRGSSNYGRQFRFANYNDWGGRDYQDLMAGVDHVIAMGVADPDRLGVMGWSYGGYMTSWIVTQTRRFKAAAIGAAVTNLLSFTGTADIPGFLPDYFSGETWQNPAAYLKHSPLAHVKGVTTPSLILHGEADVRVPISQGYEFYNALKRQGVTTQMVVYPRTPHGPREPKFQLDLMERHLAWMEKYLR